MLLDATAILLAVGLAAAGFVVVVVVSAVVLRLIGFIVGDYDPAPADLPDGGTDATTRPAAGDASVDQDSRPPDAAGTG